ncbi:MAG: hypothetical protein IJJ00_03635 [Erysipelotrichaceae bacterium]|nr:hypothetical protein [Erysipelotrichaceae bacterium]
MNRKEIDLEILKLRSGHTEDDVSLIDAFFDELDKRENLFPAMHRQMYRHFIKAFEYCLDKGKSVKETCELLDPVHLGEFFTDTSKENYALDNAAIIYPLGIKHGQMPMFRLSVTLKEDIVPAILQIALYFTIKRFPTFQTIVKTGFFWHYLETTYNLPLVEKERDIPCKPISIILRSKRSFRVFYFKKRISIEFFHVLTDGTGGMVFLKTLTAEYLRLLGKDSSCTEGVLDVDENVKEEELVNEFENAQGEDDLGTFLDKRSLQLDGRLTPVKPHHIIHYDMDVSSLKEVCAKYNGTITAYLLAVMFKAVERSISNKNGIFNIQVPVNMRKFNHSKTLRNYSMYFSAAMDMKELPDLNELVAEMGRQIKEKGSERIMNQMMKATGKIIGMLSAVPLILKNPIVQLAYGYLSNGIIGTVLSNVGVVTMPEEISDDVDHFDFLLVPEHPNRVAATLISYKDRVRFTIASATASKTFEEEIYKMLTDEGLDVITEGSIDYES